MSERADLPAGTERRRAPRKAHPGLQAELEVALESEVLYLSSGGMMVRLDFAPALGREHRFTLTFPDRTLHVRGAVRNTEPATDGVAGTHRVGVEFLDLPDDDRAFLDAFVADRLP